MKKKITVKKKRIKKKTKFFEFNQNNSGGSFVTDKQLCHRLFIEADNGDEACEIAEGMGVYFDGCSKGYDCTCCGDRWYLPYEPVEFPMKYNKSLTFKTIRSYAQHLANEYGWTKPDARIFYKNGKVVEVFSKKSRVG